MNKKTWIGHWKDLYQKINILGPEWMKSRETPTEGHLDKLEQTLNFKLPLSYRTFIAVFGPGIIAQSFTIYAPGYRRASVVDFIGHNKWQDDEATFRNDPVKIKGLVAFCSFLYDHIVWDRNHSTGTGDEIEYAVIRVPKLYDDPLLQITNRFDSFIEEQCLAGGFWRLLGEKPQMTWIDESGDELSISCFEPIGDKLTSSV